MKKVNLDPYWKNNNGYLYFDYNKIKKIDYKKDLNGNSSCYHINPIDFEKEIFIDELPNKLKETVLESLREYYCLYSNIDYSDSYEFINGNDDGYYYNILKILNGNSENEHNAIISNYPSRNLYKILVINSIKNGIRAKDFFRYFYNRTWSVLDLFIELYILKNVPSCGKITYEAFHLDCLLTKDESLHENEIDNFLNNNQEKVEQYKKGKIGLINYFKGQIMKDNEDFDPNILERLLNEKLKIS